MFRKGCVSLLRTMAWWIHSFTNNLFELLSKESMFKLLFDSVAKHGKASSLCINTNVFQLIEYIFYGELTLAFLLY